MPPISSRCGRVERGRGAFLPDLLMAALQRTIALAEVNRLAPAVAEHLDFDMARLVQIFFEIDRIVAERRLGLGLGGGDRAAASRRRPARPSCRARRRPPPP